MRLLRTEEPASLARVYFLHERIHDERILGSQESHTHISIKGVQKESGTQPFALFKLSHPVHLTRRRRSQNSVFKLFEEGKVAHYIDY
jgi:hypothetical protein